MPTSLPSRRQIPRGPTRFLSRERSVSDQLFLASILASRFQLTEWYRLTLRCCDDEWSTCGSGQQHRLAWTSGRLSCGLSRTCRNGSRNGRDSIDGRLDFGPLGECSSPVRDLTVWPHSCRLVVSRPCQNSAQPGEQP